jgi:hypothetical protein
MAISPAKLLDPRMRHGFLRRTDGKWLQE